MKNKIIENITKKSQMLANLVNGLESIAWNSGLAEEEDSFIKVHTLECKYRQSGLTVSMALCLKNEGVISIIIENDEMKVLLNNRELSERHIALAYKILSVKKNILS